MADMQPLLPGQSARPPGVLSSIQPLLPDSGSAGLVEATVGGFASGLRRDPFLRSIVEHLGAVFDMGPEQLDQLEAKLAGSRTASVTKFIGEFAPYLVGGGLAFAGARGLARAGLVRLGAGAAEGSQLARAAARLGQTTATSSGTIPITALQRATEIGAGGLGVGGFEGVHQLAGGAPLGEAAKSAALAALLTGGIEGAITVAGKAIRTAREVKRAPVVERFKKLVGPERARQILGINKKLTQLNDEVRAITKAADEEQRLLTLRNQPAEPLARPKPRPLPERRPGFFDLDLAPRDRSGRPIEVVRLGVGPQAAFEAGERRLTELTGLTSKKQKLVQDRRALRAVASDDPSVVYTSLLPDNPSGVWGTIRKATDQVLNTPESYLGRTGVVGGSLLRKLASSEQTSMAGAAFSARLLGDAQGEMLKGLGVSERAAKHLWVDLFDAWEHQGAPGVGRWLTQHLPRADQQRVLGAFKTIDDYVNETSALLGRRGGPTIPALDEMRLLGREKYLPHLAVEMPNDLLLNTLTKVVGPEDAQRLAPMMKPGGGLRRLASQDLQRGRPGTLKELTRQGLPVEANPWLALYAYSAAAYRRLAASDVIGMNGKLQGVIVDLIKKEGGRGDYFNDLMNIVFGFKAHDAAMRKMSDTVLGYQVGSKLTLAVLPNMSQPMNLLLGAGFRNLLRGSRDLLTGGDRDAQRILHALALNDTVISGLRRAHMREGLLGGGATSGSRALDLAANASDLYSYNVLRFTGFNSVEKMDRKLSGYTGRAMFLDIMAKASRGRLRGENLERARRQMSSLGVSLDDTLKGLREGRIRLPKADGSDLADLPVQAWERLEMTAAWRLAQGTQFLASATRRPLAWNHPLGRVMFQFKNFALGQGKLMKDAVFAEAAKGNLKPLAYWIALFPIAGELVKDMRSLATGRPREEQGVARLYSDMMAVGGLGIASDALTQARFGRALEWLAGPTVADMADVGEALSRGDADAVRAQIARQPIFLGMRSLLGASLVTTEWVDQYLGLLDTDDRTGQSLSLDELRWSTISSKRK